MTELLLAIGLIAGAVAAHDIGFWLGSLTRSADEPFDRQVDLVRTLTAALVAFLIGFAFSGAASRFIDRQDIIVKEANALGTAYLRAETIADPQRGELKAAIKEYTADRVTLLSRDTRPNRRLARQGKWLARTNVEVGDRCHAKQRAIDGGSSAADQRDHRSTFDAPGYGEKASAHSDHDDALGHGGNRRWYDWLRQWSCWPPVFCARRRLRYRSCGRFVDGCRPRLSGDRHH
jgi:hypothetical protein